MKYQQVFTLAVCFGTLACPTLAGTPLNVDDPGTSEAKHTTINLSYISSQVSGSETQQVPSLSLGYGLNQTVELDLGLAENSNRTSGTDRVNGFGDINLGAKWRFQEETKNRPQFSFAGSLKVPSASHRRGLGSGKTDYNLAFATAKSFGKAQLMANGGYNFLGRSDAGEKDNAFYGVAITYQATEALNVGAQVYGNQTAAEGSHSELAYGIGVTDTLTSDRALLVAVGRSARGLSDLNLYVGYQLIIGPKEAPETKAPETKAPETKAPKSKAPDTK